MSEVALGGGLAAVGFPYRSALLTGIGMGILALAFAMSRNIPMLLGAGAVAAAVNLLGVPIMHLTVACKANACLAVFIEGGSLSLMAAVLMKRRWSNAFTRSAAGAGAALLASTGFYLAGMHVAPCPYLLSFGNVGGFVVREGLIWAGFAAVLVPLGYMVGQRLAERFPLEAWGRPLVFYAVNTGIIASAIGVSSLAITIGL